MSNIILILGQSGSGKSYSLKNMDINLSAVISPIQKAFPFKSKIINRHVTDNWQEITNSIVKASKKFPVIIVEDFQYVMVNEFMHRINDKGYGKFNDIASHAWTIVNTAASLQESCRIYFLCQSEIDESGREKMKTIGKALDGVVDLQGLFDAVVLCKNNEGKFYFRTKSLGDRVDSVKSPEGMFDQDEIPNDIKILDKYVDDFFNKDVDYSRKNIEEKNRNNHN